MSGVVFFLYAFLLQVDQSCSEEVRSQLTKWEARGPWERLIPNIDEIDVTRSPSATSGFLIEKHLLKSGEIHLIRRSRQTLDLWIVKPPNCSPQVVRQALNEEHLNSRVSVPGYSLLGEPVLDDSPEFFTDKDLLEILNTQRSTVVYAWSPHMPLSIDGVEEIERAAKQLSLDTVFVVDPHADKKRVEETIAKHPNLRGSRLIVSDELLMRGFGQHYPSLIAIKAGKIHGRIIPGFKFHERYGELLRELLSK